MIRGLAIGFFVGLGMAAGWYFTALLLVAR